MRPFDDDYDDLDDLEFDRLAASRRPPGDRQHHRKSAGRKRHKAAHKARWESEESGVPDDFYDSYEDEFDRYYESRIGH